MAASWLERFIAFGIGFVLCITIYINRPTLDNVANKITAEVAPIISSWDSINAPIERFNLKFRDVVMAQIAHETHYCTSAIYNENHNPFGMKHNKRGYSIGSNRGHAVYRTLDDAFLDMQDYQKRYMPYYEKKHGKIKTDQDYVKFLRAQGYAEDTGYSRKIGEMLEVIKIAKKIKTDNTYKLKN